MFRSGLRKLIARLSRELDAKADPAFGSVARASAQEDSAGGEFITAYIVAREPVSAPRIARARRASGHDG